MKIQLFPLLLLSGILNGQNLVPNNSFNTYTSPPDDYAQMCRATGWSSATGDCFLVIGSGSPEYYNTNGSGGASTPNTFWATVSPHTGSGMAGFAPWYTSSNFREYIRCQLTSPLVVGTTYEVSMWLTNGNSTLHGYGCNKIGVYFSNTQTNQSGGSPITSVTPQCEMSTVFWNTNWQKVTFNYTATAAYKYMCIGNFRNDAATTAILESSGGTSGCYVYIDDVVVQPSVILPIQLTSFTALLTSEHIVALKWSTATELNNDYFTVERSSNGNDFAIIGKLDGYGTIAESHEYFFNDEHPQHGANYYRIGQTDFNGDRTYSPVQMVDVNLVSSKIKLVVSPNPAASPVNIRVLVAKDFSSPMEISVLDVSGRMVLRKDISEEDIFNEQFQVSPGRLPAGLYLIQLFAGRTLLASEKLLAQ